MMASTAVVLRLPPSPAAAGDPEKTSHAIFQDANSLAFENLRPFFKGQRE